MRMITNRMKNLLVAVVCLLTGVQAHAQFSAEASQYPTTDYSASAFQFQLSAIAATLETDAATLSEAIGAYISAEVPDPILFYAVVNGEDVWFLDGRPRHAGRMGRQCKVFCKSQH